MNEHPSGTILSGGSIRMDTSGCYEGYGEGCSNDYLKQQLLGAC